MWHIFDFWAALFTMKNTLFKLILGLLLTANGVFGQDSSGKTTRNVDSVRVIKYKRNVRHKEPFKYVPPVKHDWENAIPGKIMLADINRKSAVLVDSTKPIDTTLINRPIQTLSSFQPYCRICGPSRASVISNEPLYVLKNDNRILGREIMEQISSKLIESINVLKDASTTAKYGSHAANGVIEITLKEDSVFLSVEELLVTYKLPKHYRTLPLYINKNPFPKEQLLLQRSSVTGVKIAEELENGVKEKHIEVTTTDKK